MAQARRRPPPGGARRPPGRRPPEAEEEEEEIPIASPAPPVWERMILSRTFKMIVMGVFAAAFLSVVVYLIGPTTVNASLGNMGGYLGRNTGRLGTTASNAIAVSINDEGRRIWVETATPLATFTPTATPEPTATTFPTPPPPRRAVSIATQPAGPPPAPGQPRIKPPNPPPFPIDDAVNSMREYFEIVATGDVRRALQYWMPDAAPEARSALDAAIARREKYVITNLQPRPLAAAGGAEITVDLEVTTDVGLTTTVQHRYQWRFLDSQWFISARLQ